MPAIALGLDEVATEATLDGGRHDAEVVLVDAPVEPSDLDTLLAAAFDDPDGGVDGGETALVVAALWVDEEVLHVDDDEDRLGRVDHDTAVVADSIVGVDDEFLVGATRKIEALCVGHIQPLVIAAERDRL